MTNAINPSHYKSDTIECIDAMKACSTPEEFRGHLKLTVLKYLWREDKKGDGDQARVENLEKAAWYLDRLVNDLRGDTVHDEIPPHTINAADQGWIENKGKMPLFLPQEIQVRFPDGKTSTGSSRHLRWTITGGLSDIAFWRPSK